MKKKSRIVSFITGITITASLLSITASAALNEWSLIRLSSVIHTKTVENTDVKCKQYLYSYGMENNSSQKRTKATTINYRWGIAGYNGNTSFLGWVQGYTLDKCAATAQVTTVPNRVLETVTKYNLTGNGSSSSAETNTPYDGVHRTYCNVRK